MIPGLIVAGSIVRMLWVNAARRIRERRATLDAYQAEGRKHGIPPDKVYEIYKRDHRKMAQEEFERSQWTRKGLSKFLGCLGIVVLIYLIWWISWFVKTMMGS